MEGNGEDSFQVKIGSPSKAESEEEDPFQTLPDELVLQILTHLDHRHNINRVALVSRRFGRLALDASLRTEFDSLKIHSRYIAEPLLDRFPLMRKFKIVLYPTDATEYYAGVKFHLATYAAQNFRLLREIVVYGYPCYHPRMDANELESFFEAIGNRLKRLDIRYVELDLAILSRKAYSLRNLTHLFLSCVFLGKTDKGKKMDLAIRALADHCTHLQALTMLSSMSCDDLQLGEDALIYFLDNVKGTIRKLVFLSGFTNACLVRLGGCLQLEKLNIYNVRSLHRSGLEAISKLHKLNYLGLSPPIGSEQHGGITATSKDLLDAFVSGHATLRVLKFKCYSEWYGTALRTVADLFPELSDLCLKHCRDICKEDVFYVMRACPKLRHLCFLTEYREVSNVDRDKSFWDEKKALHPGCHVSFSMF